MKDMTKGNDKLSAAVAATINELSERYDLRALDGSTKDHVLSAANALMFSRTLDILVDSSIVSAEVRDNLTAHLYRSLNVL